MSVEESIQIGSEPSGGKKLRALKNNVGGVDVHSEVTAVQDGLGNVVDPRNIRALTAADKVSVNVESLPAVTGSVAVSSLPAVSGEVTANAGINLNTSALLKAADLLLDAAKHLHVDVESMPAVTGSVAVSSLPTVTGAVTANAGSNLNTSALALESGGKLASAEANIALLVHALESIAADSVLVKQLDLDLLTRTLLNSPLMRTRIASTNELYVVDTNKSVSYLTGGGNVPAAGAPVIGSGSWQWVWCGPVDQRWELIQRSNIEYAEGQRRNFTF